MSRKAPGYLQGVVSIIQSSTSKVMLTSTRRAIWERDPEPDTPLNDQQFARPNHQLAHVRMYVKPALLWQDEHVSVVVAEGLVSHALVGRVYVNSHSLKGRAVAVSGHGSEAINER